MQAIYVEDVEIDEGSFLRSDAGSTGSLQAETRRKAKDFTTNATLTAH